MRALVFGGTHRLGHDMVSEIRKAGHDVAVIDFRDSDPEVEPVILPTGVRCQLLPHPSAREPMPAVEFAASDFDVVFFCASDPFPGMEEPLPSDEWLTAERHVLETVLQGGPAALVLTSSAAVYDLRDSDATLTEDSRLAARPEGVVAHLLALEGLARQAASSGWAVGVLRFSVMTGAGALNEIYGRKSKMNRLAPGLRGDGVSYPVVSAVLDAPQGEPEPAVNDFIDVADIASAQLATARWLLAHPAEARTFNVGGGPAPSMTEIAYSAEEVENLELRVVDLREPGRGPRLDCGAIEAELGWTPGQSPASVALSELQYFKYVLREACKIGFEVRITSEYVASRLSKRFLTLFGLLVVRDKTGLLRNRAVRFQLGRETYEPWVATKRGIPVPLKQVRVSPYRLRVPRAALSELGLQNPLRVVYIAPGGEWLRRRVRYSMLLPWPLHRRSRIYRLPETDSAMYVRQTDTNHLNVTVRVPNETDRLSMQLKVRLAWLAAKIFPRKSVVLYEKQSARYEESAAVVYEQMMDRGRGDAYYILAPEAIGDVPERYRTQVLRRFSFRHFYHFFCATTFIGTETVFSAAELRSADRALMRHISAQRYKFVFLQHGVMYMVALSSRQRRFFRAGVVFPEGTKIVCSSKREARHFIDLGGFSPDDMYVCGLPKFDHATREARADRILIMPTWRPWEHNDIRTDPTSVPYYLMVREIFDAVPDELKDRVYLLPHPLVKDVLAETDLRDRMWTEESYDVALRHCSLLITDYSSIAYDALYRGANVIFWWKEKDYCMSQYGGHLMIDEETAPGPVCYDSEELSRLVREKYLTPQDDEYVRRYRQIVEFHDGKNTERLLSMMERDGLI